MSISITGLTELMAALAAVQAVVAEPFAAPGVVGLASDFAVQLEELLREAAPKRESEGRRGSFYTAPGEFAAGIEALSYSTGTNVTVEASAIDPLMTWIIGGTNPHPIDPVTRFMLQFPDRTGQEVFRFHVDHPGTKANPFQEEPANVIATEMLAAYTEAIALEAERAASS